MRTPAKRSFFTQALGVVCVVLVFAMGTVQAVHSHPLNSQASHHSCSVCSAPSMGPIAATVGLLPTARPVAMAYSARETFVVFRPVVTNFVRPPPAV
jgi:hypothetical protein